MTSIITAKNVRRMRSKLEASLVPIVLATSKTTKEYERLASELNEAIRTNNYMPSNGHGYLGYPKKDGCTRFVPILTVIDTIVYYSIVWAIEDAIIETMDGVYGAWHTKPEKITIGSSPSEIDEYSSNTFNKLAWFSQWSSYSELLHEILNDETYGNYVLLTDIANFYDTIDVGRLCDEIRSKVDGSQEVVSLLRFFLQYWDRRLKGYSPSSKGIPQELISDASRTLANFYLSDFDRKFKDVCKAKGVTYVRWADDIVLIGKSKKSLEHTLHEGSRLLLSIGLNFNASQTTHFTRKNYYEYRGLEVMRSMKTTTVVGLEKAVKKFVSFYSQHGGRMDSVLRACISKLYSSPAFRTPYLLNFVIEKASDYYLVGMLDEKQMFRFCAINRDPKKALDALANLINRYPYASAKATLLESFRKQRAGYIKIGIAEEKLRKISEKIKENSGDSEILTDICLPAFGKMF